MINIPTVEDLQEIVQEIEIIKGEVAKLTQNFNQLVAELKEKAQKK